MTENDQKNFPTSRVSDLYFCSIAILPYLSIDILRPIKYKNKFQLF